MKVILIRAIRNMFVGQIDLKPQPFKAELLDGKYYVSSIELHSKKEKEQNHFTLVLSESLLKQVCSVLLFEDEPDTATLEDMGTEVANQIIGNAKVLVESVKQETLHLTIPKVEKSIKLEDVVKKEHTLLFKFNDDDSIWFLMSREILKD
jgi:chemotaxis protein CheY-P-specific phosphatase CheC